MTEKKTPNDDVAIRRKIRSLKKAAADLRLLTPSDAELADTVGRLRSVEVAVAEQRHRYERIATELEPVVEYDPSKRVDPKARAGAPVAEGREFDLVPKFKTNRTYNTPAILVEISEHIDGGPLDAIMEAIAFDAARLTWRWTDLKKFLLERGATLRIGADPVDDHSGLDAPMIGEERVSAGFDRVPKKTP